MLEGGHLGVAVDVLRLPHVPVQVVVVDEGGHAVGGRREAVVLLGDVLGGRGRNGRHGLVDLEVGPRRRFLLLHRTLAAEGGVLREKSECSQTVFVNY